MKKGHILGIIVMAIVVVIIVSSLGGASSYVTFDQARVMADNGSNKKVHVIGELKKDELGRVVGIKEGQNKLSFTFLMIDESQKEQLVYYNEPIPADFIRSEQVVIVGSYRNEMFVADRILLKCPSKYQETELGGPAVSGR
jgi:cytochrome c-type biogenesis protein CcmE